MEYDAILNIWAYVGSGERGYLVGTVEGDKRGRFPDGTSISTSRIGVHRPLHEGMIVQTASGTRYKLGKPKPTDEKTVTENASDILTASYGLLKGMTDETFRAYGKGDMTKDTARRCAAMARSLAEAFDRLGQ